MEDEFLVYKFSTVNSHITRPSLDQTKMSDLEILVKRDYS